MESYIKTPFNIDLLILDKSLSKYLGHVSKTTIMATNSSNFDKDGLFSTEIFGQVGSEKRNVTFGYIDLKVKVYHPLVYQHLTTLKAFYKEVMRGKAYAKFDETVKDLVPSTPTEGETGFTFFTKMLPKIKFETNDSDTREYKVALVNLFKNPDQMLDKWLVLPAGLRDYVVSEDGKITEDEVNNIYRSLIITSNLLNNINLTPANESTVDGIKFKIQTLVLDIYEHFKTLLDGKNKFIQGKWAKRGIVYGTRNVITPSIPNITDLNQENLIGVDDTVVGLYQFLRAISPKAMNQTHTMFVNKIMNPSTTTAKVVNPKTMKTELVEIPANKLNEWLTLEGLDDIIGKLKQPEIRSMPVMVGKYYMMLVHDKNNIITVVDNTAELPEDLDPKYLRPITYYEMFYISIYEVRNIYPAFLTRYPVANLGGIYPCKLYVKTTENPRTVDVIMDGQVTKMYEFPNLKEEYYNSLSPHPSHIDTLGADYDGDTVSLNVLHSNDSIKEIDRVISSKEFFINPSGGLTYSVESETIKYVTKHLADTLNKTSLSNEADETKKQIKVYGENHMYDEDIFGVREKVKEFKPDIIIHELWWEEEEFYEEYIIIPLEPSNVPGHKYPERLSEQFKVREEEMISTIKDNLDKYNKIAIVVGDTHLRTKQTKELGNKSPLNEYIESINGEIYRSENKEID